MTLDRACEEGKVEAMASRALSLSHLLDYHISV